MKEKIYKITYMLMMFFMASSFEMFAATPDGPDEPVVTKDNPENPPTSTTTLVNMPSPEPEQAIADHSEADQSVMQPILSLDNDNYAMVSFAHMGGAAPISMMSKSMPASFTGVASNEIIGWENLNNIFNDIAKGEKTIKILQIGDSHVRGNIYPQTIQKSLESKLNARHKSISFDYMGINGARAAKFTSEDLLRQIAAKHPDLVIISFGTNEAHGNFSSSNNTQVMQTLVNGIRKNNPNVTFLITTTPGSYISRGSRGKVVNTTHEEVARNLLAFGKNNNIAVWDLYHNIGGNENACKNLINAGMMQGDRVHLTANGYRMIGGMFSEAFINAYNNYLKR